jgi:small neutral amino acid transporter SnatA (MarC family)
MRTREERRAISLKAVAIATLIVLVFALFGQPILNRLGVSLPALQVAGGIILLMIALDMTLSKRPSHDDGERGSRKRGGAAHRDHRVSLVALNSPPLIALHKEAEVAVGTMGIGLDYGGFGFESIPPADIAEILSAFPRLEMKRRFSETCRP